jgi:hypothetical protein
MYFRAAARTFRLHNYTHGSHLTLRIPNDLSSLVELKTKDTEHDFHGRQQQFQGWRLPAE